MTLGIFHQVINYKLNRNAKFILSKFRYYEPEPLTARTEGIDIASS